MADFQVLIEQAWSLDADTFAVFRTQFQEELDKRRPFIKEYQELIDVYFPNGAKDCASNVGEVNVVRSLLRNKISTSKKVRKRRTGVWMTPIDDIHK
tara:strand:+ start:150 stop:440 length:291 start_codon:yes stop_codon:yes gene_type:complete